MRRFLRRIDKPSRDPSRHKPPRRSLLSSRLTRLILISNLIGLAILVGGALTMNRFEAGLIDGKVDNIRSLAATITTVIEEQASGFGGNAELDIAGANQILRGINVPKDWRVRLHDRNGQVVADSEILDESIQMDALDPIITDAPALPRHVVLRQKANASLKSLLHQLPWREARRDRLRRDLRSDVRLTLRGTPQMGPRYDVDDNLVVTVSLPVQRVQQILGVVTVESSDVSNIVNAERKALAPIIGLAVLVALLSSLALTLFITLPMRKLARAAELVSRRSDKRDAIPDLSWRKDEIGDLSTVMRDMTSGLYSRIDDIANFAADVAHEIKNPLTSLRSASDTLRVAKTKDQREQLINIIQQDVSRMNRLISDISKASKVDANLAKDVAQTLNVGEILENITEFYTQTLTDEAGPKVEYALQYPNEQSVFIRAFETPFAQVLRNLIDNALTFSPKKGVVKITAGLDRTNEQEKVVIIVEDEGPGIPPDNLETVFERFYTERPKGTKFGNHSGLGLAICRQIITAHRGHIAATNKQDANTGKIIGAKFILSLPRQTKN